MKKSKRIKIIQKTGQMVFFPNNFERQISSYFQSTLEEKLKVIDKDSISQFSISFRIFFNFFDKEKSFNEALFEDISVSGEIIGNKYEIIDNKYLDIKLKKYGIVGIIYKMYDDAIVDDIHDEYDNLTSLYEAITKEICFRYKKINADYIKIFVDDCTIKRTFWEEFEGKAINRNREYDE